MKRNTSPKYNHHNTIWICVVFICDLIRTVTQLLPWRCTPVLNGALLTSLLELLQPIRASHRHRVFDWRSTQGSASDLISPGVLSAPILALKKSALWCRGRHLSVPGVTQCFTDSVQGGSSKVDEQRLHAGTHPRTHTHKMLLCSVVYPKKFKKEKKEDSLVLSCPVLSWESCGFHAGHVGEI